MMQQANDHPGDQHASWRQARVDSESDSATPPLAQDSQAPLARQAQDEPAGFSAEFFSAEGVSNPRPEMGTVMEDEQLRVAELIAATDISAQFAAQEREGTALGNLDVPPAVVEEMLRLVREAFPEAVRPGSPQSFPSAGGDSAEEGSVEEEPAGEEEEEEEQLQEEEAQEEEAVEEAVEEDNEKEELAHSGPMQKASAPSVWDSNPMRQVAGVLFIGSNGSEHPLGPDEGEVHEEESLDPNRRGTRAVKVPAIPHMENDDVNKLLRGHSERTTALYQYKFPKPPTPFDTSTQAAPVPEPAPKLSRVKSLGDKVRLRSRKTNKQTPEENPAAPQPRHKPIVSQQPFGSTDLPHATESFVHEEQYGKRGKAFDRPFFADDTSVKHAHFVNVIDAQTSHALQSEMEQQSYPHSGNRDKLFGPRGVLGRGNWQDGPPRSSIKHTPTKPSTLEKLGNLAAQFIGFRKEEPSQPGYLRRLGGKIWKTLRSPIGHVNKATAPQFLPQQDAGEEQVTSAHVIEPSGDANISVEPRRQMDMISRLEYGLNTTANAFLLQGKDQGAVSLESVRRVVQDWKKANRPLPHEFLFDFATQCELIAANADTLTFHRVGPDHLNKLAMISAFRGLSRELTRRTYCLPDLALKKLMVDGFRVMEMLGANAEEFVQLQQSQMFLNEVIIGRERQQQEDGTQQRAEFGVTKRVESPLLISSRGLIDDEDQYYNDGIYKGGPHPWAQQGEDPEPDMEH